MPIIFLLAIMTVLFAIWFGIKMKKSAKFDHIVKDITEPVDVNPKTTEGVIKDISAAEKALQMKAKAQKVEADKLQKDSAKIGDFLASKGKGAKDK